VDRRAQIYVDHTVDLLAAVFGQLPRTWKAGVGDQHVHVADLCAEGAHRGPVRQIERARLGTVAEITHEFVEHLRSPSGQDEVRAALVQGPRDRVADPAGCARKEDP
jgi:hypothetical protein